MVEHVKPTRINNARKARADKWWRHGEARPGLRAKLAGLQSYIATPETAKHRFFVRFPISIAPEHSLIVFPVDDDAIFGILSSRMHSVWALAAGGTLEDRPRYNSSMTFEKFPFPVGLSPSKTLSRPDGHPLPQAGEGLGERASIAAAAQKLNDLRENWLNPPEWTVREGNGAAAGNPSASPLRGECIPEEIPPSPPLTKGGSAQRGGIYPDHIIAKPGHEADLKKRTLTNLYNARPAWLDNAHQTLDAAVAKAYGWNDYTAEMADEEILRKLLALNLAR